MTLQEQFQRRGSLLLAGAGLFLAGLVVQRSASAVQGTGGTDTTAQRAPSMPSLANSDSNNTMIAVTGVDLTGQSVLYLVDTVNRQLAIYQASGGASGTQGIKLVGARKISLDLQLEGFNDRSEYTYEELEKKFSDNAGASSSVK